MEGLARKPEKTIEELRIVNARHRWWTQNEDQLRAIEWDRMKKVIDELRTINLKTLKEEAEKIKAETKELSQKPESDPQVVETAEFFTKMTEEILEQKDRLTKSFGKGTGKRSNPQNRGDDVFDRLRRNNSADHSLETIKSKHKPRIERAAKQNREDEKGMSEDQFIQTTTARHPKFANNSASPKDVCCDVKKYIQQISSLVDEKICSLPKEVGKKLESVMMSFQKLITGMWKLLMYDLLIYEMTSLFVSYQREELNISRKKGRYKYGFQMASMMALWLAHDVESNPGPTFGIRSCLERIVRDLSENLKSQLPVKGSLWSEAVAEAAYATGYSTDCQWSNPSGKKKDKLTTLIERVTELGRVLTTLGCLPTELAAFVNDLGNYAVQEKLVNYYKVKNLRSAVDSVLGINSLGDEQKQDIMHEIQRLKQISEVPHSSDFERLADSNTFHPTISNQEKTPVLSEVVTFPPEGDQACQKHVDHATEQEETEWINTTSPLINDDEIMGLQNLFPGQTVLLPAEGSTNGSGVEESSININPDITESDRDSDLTLQENTGEDGTISYLERDNDNLTQDRAEAEEHRTGDDDSIEHFVQGEQIAQTELETDFLQQAISPQTTSSNNGHLAVRDERNSVIGGHRKGAQDDTCESYRETFSSAEELFAAAETETEPIQQRVSTLTAVTNSYPDTVRDEMCRDTSVTRGYEAKDLTLGTEQFASTEPADTGKQRMEPTVDEQFAKFKALLIKEFEDRLDAFKSTLGNNTPNQHAVQNGNGESLDCESSGVEHTEPRVRYSDSSRKRALTDPEDDPKEKKRKQ